jgi:5-methylthioadenosine/S-adenosylhomocysteine deaminase
MTKPRQSAAVSGFVLKGATVVTNDDEGRVAPLDLRIRGGSIVEVKKKLAAKGDQEIPAHGMIAVPGLVNAHVHTVHALWRGLDDGLDFLTWQRERLWPLEGALTADEAEAAARLAMAELLLSGTTTVLDMGSVQHTDVLFQTAQKLGLRYIGGKAIMDQTQGLVAGLRETTESALAESVRLCERWHGQNDARLRYAFCPRSVLTASAAAWRACAHEARARGALLHSHVGQHADELPLCEGRLQQSAVSYLRGLDALGPNTVLAHGIWLSLDERKLLHESGTTVVHCPATALKLGCGVARLPEYLQSGLRVALGTATPAANDGQDGWRELRLACLLHRARGDQNALSPAKALALATKDGARALGLADVGVLAEGFRADIVLFKADGQAHLAPWKTDPVARLVFAARASDVDTVWVDGRMVVSHGELQTATLPSVVTAANRAASRVRSRVS